MLASAFSIPPSIPPTKRLDFCLRVLNQYRGELLPLRKKISDLIRSNRQLTEKCEKLEEERRKLKKKRTELKQESERLKREVEKLTKTTRRYQVSLFDHGNFSSPKKPTRQKGGQLGHTDTNREAKPDTGGDQVHRVFHSTCPDCDELLNRVNSYKQKQFIDIKLNPEVVKLLLQSERQWCGNCHREQLAKHENSLPFTEYGLNILMMVLILRYRCLLSLTKISLVIEIVGGVTLSKSAVNNLLTQAQTHLTGKYDELIKAVRRGEIMYADETGWLVRGKRAWLWIMSNEEVTVYQVAESRGKGIFEQMRGQADNHCMHDGYPAYTKTIQADKQMYCWSHLLRYAFEETHEEKQNPTGVKIRDQLVSVYRLGQQKQRYQETQLKQLLSRRLGQILAVVSSESSVKNIQHRVKNQKQGLINALLYSPNGTNNLAERELRNMVLLRKNTFGSDTYSGMERDAILASVVQTTHRQNLPLLPSLKQQIQVGVTKSHPNYQFGKS